MLKQIDVTSPDFNNKLHELTERLAGYYKDWALIEEDSEKLQTYEGKFIGGRNTYFWVREVAHLSEIKDFEDWLTNSVSHVLDGLQPGFCLIGYIGISQEEVDNIEDTVVNLSEVFDKLKQDRVISTWEVNEDRQIVLMPDCGVERLGERIRTELDTVASRKSRGNAFIRNNN